MHISLSNNDKKGLIVSIVIHALLLIAFVFLGLKYMVPPPPPEGITIDFGTSDEGNGTVESSPSESTPQPTTNVTPDVLTQETEEAPEVEANPNETNETVETQEEPQPNQELQNAFENWQNNQDNNTQNGNEGETGNPGNQGDESGDPNANNYNGGGNGNGISFSLSGRSMTKTPQIKNNSQDKGIVVVDIWVDQNGSVIRAVPGGRGSTTTSPILYKKAKEAALQTKFSANNNAPATQKGTMTFVFILN